MRPARPRVAPPRRLEIRHRTEYPYDKPIERSTHLFRLEPVHDRLQRVASSVMWRDRAGREPEDARNLLAGEAVEHAQRHDHL
jgi:hypothetical protein